MGRGVNNMALTWRRYSKIFRMYNKRRVFIEGMAPSEESRRMYGQNHKHPCYILGKTFYGNFPIETDGIMNISAV